MNELLRMSAKQIAKLIRNGEVSSREAVGVHIERIKQVNPTINAVVAERFELAMAEAEQADRELKSSVPDQLGPLHGVPCSIKESFALVGMPNSGGLSARKNVFPKKDATCVARLRAAGAIPLGVTNISELCMWMESNNHLYGCTNNPYDPKRHVGGSSGGEGAIVGAGGTPFGLAADVAGSIRLPAFFNGVFGHKPTGCLVPSTGQYPIAANQARRYLCTGPIARRAEDLMPLLEILAGPDGQDEVCRKFELGDPAQVDLSKIKVLDVASNGAIKVDPDLRQGQERAARALASAGANVEPTEIPELKDSFYIWSAMMRAAGGPTFSEMLGEGRALNLWLELPRWALRRSVHTLPALGLAALEKLPDLMPRLNRKSLERAPELKAELVRRIGPQGVMLYPTFSTPAQIHHRAIFKFFHSGYTSIMNVMELPSTQVPLGLNSQGIPLGVQVIATHGNDHLSIAVAMALEKALGGWRPPWEVGAL
jgi:fatty acid amide hydrolase 2